MAQPSGPFAEMAHAYRRAGWSPIFLPYNAKKDPPKGTTGGDAHDISGADIQVWLDEGHGGCNIGIVLPPNVIGVDVDAYGDKPGGETWALIGPYLAKTWRCTARDNISGIRLYRLPDELIGARFQGGLGPGIDIIQHTHRYILAPPSMHPDVHKPVRWYDPDGNPAVGVFPAVDDLPVLRLDVAHKLARPAAEYGHNDTPLDDWLDAHGGGEPLCGWMFEQAHHWIERIGQPGTRHDIATAAQWTMVNGAAEGHRGVIAALALMQAAFRDAVAGEAGRRSEWMRGVANAVSKLHDEEMPSDPCREGVPGAPPWQPLSSPASGEPQAPRGSTAPQANQALPTYRDQLLQKERLQRDVRRTVNAEEAAARFVPPPYSHNLTDELAVEFPEIKWGIDRLLPAGGNGLLVATKGVGKTTMVNNLAKAFADGEPFLNRFDVAPTGGTIGLWNYEVGRAQYKEWLGSMKIGNTDGVATLPLRGHAMPLSAEDIVDWAVAWLVEQAVRFWVLDPFARAMIGCGSENSNDDVAVFTDRLDIIKQRAGVESLLLVHHGGWSFGDDERSRGASRLVDWADAVWTYVREKKDPDKPEKANDGRYFRALGRDVDVEEERVNYDAVTRQLVMGGWDRSGDRKRQMEDDIMDLARKVGAAGMTTTELENVHGKAITIRQVRDSLVRRRLLEKDDQGRGKPTVYRLAGSTTPQWKGDND